MMDNCLASNSETGGIGCDNMTMGVVGILNGQTPEQWYEKIAQRVANGDGPCAPPEYGQACPVLSKSLVTNAWTAEFRGPGVRHTSDDSDSGYDMDMYQRTRSIISGGKRGRIILLGDGREFLTGSEETDMIDNEEEDEDLASQVHKGGLDDSDESEPERLSSSPPTSKEESAHAKAAQKAETDEKKSAE